MSWLKRKKMRDQGIETYDDSSTIDNVKEGASKVGSALSSGAKYTYEKVDSGLTTLGEKYREHKAKAPERQAAREKKQEDRLKRMKLKTETANARADLMEARNRSMGRMPSMFGDTFKDTSKEMPSMFGGGGFPSKQAPIKNPVSPFNIGRSSPPKHMPSMMDPFGINKPKKRRKRQ